MKKVIILSVCLVLTTLTFGQKKKSENKDFFNSKIGFGILLGYGKSQFNLKETNWNQTNLKDTFNSINTQSGQVLTLGSEMKLKLNNSFAYRQRLTISFENTKLKYDTKKNGIQNLDLKSVVIGLPIHFMYQTNLKTNRPFIYFGTTPKINLGDDKETKDKFQIKEFDLTADLGVGMEIKLKKFLIAPELSFSQGLLDINKNIGSSYSKTISKLIRQNVTLGIVIR